MGQVLVLTVLLNAIVIKVQALGTAHPAQPYADKIVKKSARPSASMVPAWLVWISAAKCDASQMYCWVHGGSTTGGNSGDAANPLTATQPIHWPHTQPIHWPHSQPIHRVRAVGNETKTKAVAVLLHSVGGLPSLLVNCSCGAVPCTSLLLWATRRIPGLVSVAIAGLASKTCSSAGHRIAFHWSPTCTQ